MLLLAVLYLSIALSFVLAGQAVLWCPPITFIAIRMILAGAIFLGWLYLRRRQLSIQPAHLGLFGILSFLHIGLPYAGEFWGIQYVDPAIVAFLWNASPFFTAIIEYVWHGISITRWQLAGMIVGFASLIPIIGNASSLDGIVCLTGTSIVAMIVLLIAVVSSCGGWVLFGNLQRKRYTTTFINGWAMLLGGCMISLLIPVEISGNLSATVPPFYLLGTLVMMAALIVGGNIVSYNLYGMQLRIWGATALSFGGISIPVLTAILQRIFLGTAVDMTFWFSTLGVLLAFTLFFHEHVRAAIARRFQPRI